MPADMNWRMAIYIRDDVKTYAGVKIHGAYLSGGILARNTLWKVAERVTMARMCAS